MVKAVPVGRRIYPARPNTPLGAGRSSSIAHPTLSPFIRFSRKNRFTRCLVRHDLKVSHTMARGILANMLPFYGLQELS